MSIVIKDHLGQEFKSIAAMCRYWNINVYTFLGRKIRGWNIEDALTRELDFGYGIGIPAKDHLGNHYMSVSHMARTYGLRPDALFKRLERGWSLKEALTTPVRKGLKTKEK